MNFAATNKIMDFTTPKKRQQLLGQAEDYADLVKEHIPQ
jgi:hypothetical protein